MSNKDKITVFLALLFFVVLAIANPTKAEETVNDAAEKAHRELNSAYLMPTRPKGIMTCSRGLNNQVDEECRIMASPLQITGEQREYILSIIGTHVFYQEVGDDTVE